MAKSTKWKSTQEERKKPKHRRPNRQTFKRQVTVRVDEELYGISLRRIQEQGGTFTDAVEEALLAWSREVRNFNSISMRVQMIVKSLPGEMQREVETFCAFCSFKRSQPWMEKYRNELLSTLRMFREDPQWGCREDVERLLPTPKSPTSAGGTSLPVAG
ncbi:MAG TPA: hypothetical protein VKB77_08370 [Terriglobales bacterium]|nr:hypothetical protein [Terriglobales bacterium]